MTLSTKSENRPCFWRDSMALTHEIHFCISTILDFHFPKSSPLACPGPNDLKTPPLSLHREQNGLAWASLAILRASSSGTSDSLVKSNRTRVIQCFQVFLFCVPSFYVCAVNCFVFWTVFSGKRGRCGTFSMCFQLFSWFAAFWYIVYKLETKSSTASDNHASTDKKAKDNLMDTV